MNVQSPLKWWSSRKSQVFASSSSLPTLVSGGGGQVCESVGKVDPLSDHFNRKQSRESVDLPLTCHPSPNLTTIAFRSSEVRRLLLDLDPYGGTDPFGMFPVFLIRTADVMVWCPLFGSLAAVWCPAARHMPLTTGPCSQWCQFSNRGCVCVTLLIVDL